jgi:UDP-glucose 4-epimerase
MKTYFITGGLGFIGYHICKELIKDENNKIIIYDAQKHYIPIDKSEWTFYLSYRIRSLYDQNRNRLTIIRGDCTDRGLLSESLEKYRPDIIIHLAALPIAGVSNDFPTEAKVNIFDSTVTLLDVLRGVSFKFEKIIYTSSSMVYGNFIRDENGMIIPAKEDQICNPIDLYGAMKLSGEYVVKVYHYRFGIPYVIVRPSAVYGPTDANKRVTELFLVNALQGEKLILDNGGRHQLDFTYVDDLVSGFLLSANSQQAIGETFNITRGEGRQLKELAEIISGLVPNVVIEETDIKPYRPNRGALDITKARKILGYDPKFSLEEGMKKYLDFIQAIKK